MRIHHIDVRLQEVPDEVSLVIHVAGCKIGCKNCHWDEINKEIGENFSIEDLEAQIILHKGLVTCILYMGGEDDKDLVEMLKICKKNNLKTCLYTGRCGIIKDITQHLDYLKEGPFLEEKGGLDSPTTNQRFYKLPEYTDLTETFHK